MSNETSKTKKFWTPQEVNYLKGNGIDIGCGNDPVYPHVQPFDLEHGDANKISEYVKDLKDFVFSSHCLEHMNNPEIALTEWFKVLKPGGYLFVLVPDEDLYEQGFFPSRYNSDHKWTFTISKAKSWSPKSVNVLDLVKKINAEVISIKLQDYNYDYQIYSHKSTWWSRKCWRSFRRVSEAYRGTPTEVWLSRIYSTLGASFDQTAMGGDRLSQIQFILRKPI
jgi:SAM-dependent methyltransferase